jgi:hypothetical protein
VPERIEPATRSRCVTARPALCLAEIIDLELLRRRAGATGRLLLRTPHEPHLRIFGERRIEQTARDGPIRKTDGPAPDERSAKHQGDEATGKGHGATKRGIRFTS